MIRSKKYEGIVVRTGADATHVTVRLADAKGCGTCPIAGACASQSPGCEVEAVFHHDMNPQPGDHVTLYSPSETFIDNKWMWILIPCAILIATTLIMEMATDDYSTVTLVSLIAVALYFAAAALWRAFSKRRAQWIINSIKR